MELLFRIRTFSEPVPSSHSCVRFISFIWAAFTREGDGEEAAMSEDSGRSKYEDAQGEEDDAIADSGTELAYRRLAASGAGEPQQN